MDVTQPVGTQEQEMAGGGAVETVSPLSSYAERSTEVLVTEEKVSESIRERATHSEAHDPNQSAGSFSSIPSYSSICSVSSLSAATSLPVLNSMSLTHTHIPPLPSHSGSLLPTPRSSASASAPGPSGCAAPPSPSHIAAMVTASSCGGGRRGSGATTSPPPGVDPGQWIAEKGLGGGPDLPTETGMGLGGIASLCPSRSDPPCPPPVVETSQRSADSDEGALRQKHERDMMMKEVELRTQGQRLTSAVNRCQFLEAQADQVSEAHNQLNQAYQEAMKSSEIWQERFQEKQKEITGLYERMSETESVASRSRSQSFNGAYRTPSPSVTLQSDPNTSQSMHEVESTLTVAHSKLLDQNRWEAMRAQEGQLRSLREENQKMHSQVATLQEENRVVCLQLSDCRSGALRRLLTAVREEEEGRRGQLASFENEAWRALADHILSALGLLFTRAAELTTAGVQYSPMDQTRTYGATHPRELEGQEEHPPAAGVGEVGALVKEVESLRAGILTRDELVLKHKKEAEAATATIKQMGQEHDCWKQLFLEQQEQVMREDRANQLKKYRDLEKRHKEALAAWTYFESRSASLQAEMASREGQGKPPGYAPPTASPAPSSGQGSSPPPSPDLLSPQPRSPFVGAKGKRPAQPSPVDATPAPAPSPLSAALSGRSRLTKGSCSPTKDREGVRGGQGAGGRHTASSSPHPTTTTSIMSEVKSILGSGSGERATSRSAKRSGSHAVVVPTGSVPNGVPPRTPARGATAQKSTCKAHQSPQPPQQTTPPPQGPPAGGQVPGGQQIPQVDLARLVEACAIYMAKSGVQIVNSTDSQVAKHLQAPVGVGAAQKRGSSRRGTPASECRDDARRTSAASPNRRERTRSVSAGRKAGAIWRM